MTIIIALQCVLPKLRSLLAASIPFVFSTVIEALIIKPTPTGEAQALKVVT
jgi:hypothetical protein